jgi:hypothetical protein
MAFSKAVGFILQAASHAPGPERILHAKFEVIVEDDVARSYDTRIDGLRVSHESATRTWRRFANVRLAVFVLVAAAVWWTASGDGEASLLRIFSVPVTLAAFIGLVVLSSRARALVVRFADLLAINEEGLHRVRREWSALELRAWDAVPASHPYAGDLDVFGSASLVQLFPALSAAPGRTTLASWLLSGADPGELVLRQRAVAELKDRIEWRDELILHTRRINNSAGRLHAFREWAGQDGWPGRTRWPGVAAIVLPVTTALLAVAQAFGLVDQAFWLVPIVLGGILTMLFRRQLRDALAQVQGKRNVLRGYAMVAQLVSGETFHSEMLLRIQRELGGGAAARDMRSLETIADCADVRLSPMLHFVVQALTLWDFHVIRYLNRWKHGAGSHVGAWIDALGQVESLVALATVAHDNPSWVFPVIDTDGPAELVASALGHPLLSASVRVANDVTVGPAGTLLFVTGSNMAGKSTLLRSIGLNVVLAQAGSVVCASKMRCPPVTLYTSMRVQDSLERGVSYFMAELERLKLIVDAASGMQRVSGRTLLYLLDEILHGTNSAERAIAARHVLARLIDLGAIGAVTTHDLQLADAEVFARAAQQVHFQESFTRTDGGRPSMHFDYVLRPGKATSSNALKLLEVVGLATVADVT